MKHLLISTAAAVLLLGTAAANAGPAYAPFDGFYVGGEVGGVNSKTSVDSSDKLYGQGVTGALFAGYGVTYNSIYFGAEANGSLSSLKTTFGDDDLKRQYGFGVAGRLGYVVAPATLAYGVVGWERGKFELKAADVTDSQWLDGIRLGLGLEHKLTQNVSVRGEFDYTNWQKKDGLQADEFALKAGVAYHF